MTEFQYDESISTEVDNQRRYDLDLLKIDHWSLGNVAAATHLELHKVEREHKGWTGSEDYSDLLDSIGVLYKYYGNRMLAEAYSGDANFNETDYAFRDMEDLHLSLSTLEQFGKIKYLKRDWV